VLGVRGNVKALLLTKVTGKIPVPLPVRYALLRKFEPFTVIVWLCPLTVIPGGVKLLIVGVG
jgi:hypothetical protein